jgi:hypothetical protein
LYWHVTYLWAARPLTVAWCAPPSTRSLERSLSTLGQGALTAIALAWAGELPRAELEPSGAPVVWLCDRDGHALVGLDRDGLGAARIPVRWPLEVAAGPLASPWVLAATRPGGFTERRLLRVPGGERVVEELRLPMAQALRCDPSGAALFLRGSGPERELVRYEPGGSPTALAPAPGASHWLLVGGDLWLASELELCVRDLTSGAVPVRAVRRWPEGERCLDLAPAPGGAWVLSEGGGQRRLRRMTPELGLLQGREWARGRGAAVGAVQLITRSGQREVWSLERVGGLRRLYPAGGASHIERLVGLAAEAGVSAPGGGLWCLTPGACLLLDPHFRLLRAQGGFERLVAVDTAVR